MANILVTGGAGFIGSNYIKYKLGSSDDFIVNLDALTYAGNLNNLADVENNDKYKFIHGDIRNRTLVEEIFDKYKIDMVINFAAESHVDRSIEEPEVFLTTNIVGTQILLDVAKDKWRIHGNEKKHYEYRENVKFLQVSTDEVYGSLGHEGLFTEKTPLSPNSPYSASKASADMIVRAYNETFNLPINITRCSNNYGAYQFPEKLIPLIINNCINNDALPVYGDGKQIRDWLHVYDHCTAIDTVLLKGELGEVYNVGGNNEKENIYIVRLIIRELNKSNDLIEYVSDRPGHDRRYAIDNSKITNELGWSPQYTFEDGIKETIEWYMSNSEWLESVLSNEYRAYYHKQYNG